MVAAIRQTTNKKAGEHYHYIPLFISVKAYASYSNAKALEECTKIAETLGEEDIKSGLCILVLIGCKDRKNDDGLMLAPDDVHSISSSIVSKVVVIPSSDEFQLSEAFANCSYAPHEIAEIYTSHGLIKVLPCELPEKRVTDSKPEMYDTAARKQLQARSSKPAIDYLAKLMCGFAVK